MTVVGHVERESAARAIGNFPLVGSLPAGFTTTIVTPEHDALRISLLGGFHAEREGVEGPVRGWQRRSAKTLTKLLAVAPSHALHREQIMEILWPGLDLESALNGLGKALHAARRALEPELPPRKSSQYLELADCMLSLNPERVAVDADHFQRLAEDAQRVRGLKAYEVALAAYRGELLPEDRYEEWCAERRSFLSELHLRLLLGVAEVHESAGAFGAAEDRLREVLEADMTREEVHRRLMRVYARMGLRERALSQFQLCRAVLRRELGLNPQRETVALYEELLNDEASGAEERHADRDLGQVRSTACDGERAPLVGRGEVLRSLCARLGSLGAARLVVVTGEPGIGKSRLLSELASEARRAGAAVLSSGNGPPPRRLAYGPFALALESYMAERSEVDRDELARRHPGLVRYLPSLRMDDAQSAYADHHLELSAAVARLLTDLARDQPVLLILGDLGESDPLSLDLLRYLAQLAATRRWLLAAALRDGEAEGRTEVHRTIDGLTREGLCSRVGLGRLSREDCDELACSHLSPEPADCELLDWIYGQSRGNPLFVGELISEARRRGELTVTAGCWRRAPRASQQVPPRIRQLVAARLDLQDDAVKRVVSLASAAARDEISFRALRAGASALDPPIPDGALLDALDHALDLGLLEEHESGYAFRHPLVASALYEELSRPRQDQLRTALADAGRRRSRTLRVAAAG